MTLRRRALYTLGIFAVGAGLAASALPLRLPEVCLFKRITGLPCCGCGMTHAFCALAHGDFGAAAGFNAASIPLALLLAMVAVLLVAEAVSGRPFLQPFYKKTGRVLFYLAPPILLFAWSLNLAKVLVH